MKVNKWTLGLAAVGLVSLPALGLAEEKSNPVMSALSSTTISGYVNTSMHWNPGTSKGPDGITRAPGYAYGGAAKSDGFNLDVVKLTIEKALDEDQWAAGYKVDLLFGPDANALGTTSTGVGGNNTSDFAIKQAYVALRAPVGNGLDFKVGVFDTVIGYESFDAGNNPNYTRSYGYTLEPTTHTGVLATYQFTEWIGASAGIANTFGPQINQRAWNGGGVGTQDKAESYKTYLGSIVLTAPESFGFLKGSTLYMGVVNGWNSGSVTANAANRAVQTSYYAGVTMNTPVAGLKVGASYDYAGVSNQVLDGAIRSGYANAVAGYVSYQVTEKLSVHGRGEYATQTPANSVNGMPSKIVAGTATIQYDLWKNVVSRLEFRWDHQADGNERAYGATRPPTGGANSSGLTGSRRNAYLLAANFIYKF